MVVALVVSGCFMIAFAGLMWCCCKVAGDADKRSERDNYEDVD